jgi:hypothetical protein
LCFSFHYFHTKRCCQDDDDNSHTTSAYLYVCFRIIDQYGPPRGAASKIACDTTEDNALRRHPYVGKRSLSPSVLKLQCGLSSSLPFGHNNLDREYRNQSPGCNGSQEQGTIDPIHCARPAREYLSHDLQNLSGILTTTRFNGMDSTISTKPQHVCLPREKAAAAPTYLHATSTTETRKRHASKSQILFNHTLGKKKTCIDNRFESCRANRTLPKTKRYRKLPKHQPMLPLLA